MLVSQQNIGPRGYTRETASGDYGECGTTLHVSRLSIRKFERRRFLVERRHCAFLLKMLFGGVDVEKTCHSLSLEVLSKRAPE